MEKELEYMRRNHPEILAAEPPYVAVRFAPDVKLTYDDDGVKQLTERQFAPLKRLTTRFPGLRMTRLYQALPPDKLGDLVKRAQEVDETYRPGPLFSYFKVEYDDPAQLPAIAKEMQRWKEVEHATVYVPAPSPFVNAADDVRAVNQTYLDAAPGGIDARYAWNFVGGDGQGQRLIDIERGWTFNHEDLVAHASLTNLNGSILDADRGHGTSVLGEICAVDNAIGCVGITPHIASVRGSSFSGSTQQDAILVAVANLSFGDVILLEAQNWVPGIPMMLGPIEVLDAAYEAIRLATALGIIVVEAGGNGTNNGSTPPFALDTYVSPGGDAILNPGGAGFRDSGAIIVSAATSAAPHTRMPWAPHGQRIDNYAWGQNINTLNSDSSGATNLYSTSFGGTSGASPMITGAALSINGIAEANLGFRFGPRQMRTILRNPATGTAPAATETSQISVMPNLRQIIGNLLMNVAPDVYVRDFVGDTGNSHSGAISASPDIIVRPAAEANPQAAFGEGSGTENSNTLGSRVVASTDHFIYVRMRNRGGSAATNVQATVYWSPPASLVTPDLWTLAGSVNLPTVPNGSQLTVSDAITWPAASIPPVGHYCYVGLIGNALDPAPTPVDFLNWNNFQLFIRNNNNVTWRNFNVVSAEPGPDAPLPDFVALPFLLVGAPDKARAFDITIEGKLPEGARLLFQMPIDLFRQARQFLPKAELINRQEARAQLNPFQQTLLKGMKLPAKYRGKCQLLLHIPKELRKRPFQLMLSQYYRKQQVGGLTWQTGARRL
ncbi:S8 family serine peptidase [Spirosoma taeanense]|uniref:S8 family serine peptidase n=1 Tax=Spirosoma taeanense TaxID=2735870 RepID=A0A6M5Y5P3_9BACT|nr:S8 family peptidase [Spirosoma taeanense]QJW89169.1 S8 family serine peptidase [Spirosoma taeanense]